MRRLRRVWRQRSLPGGQPRRNVLVPSRATRTQLALRRLRAGRLEPVRSGMPSEFRLSGWHGMQELAVQAIAIVGPLK